MSRIYGGFKTELFASLSGTLLEIGPGAGSNFEHYPRGLEITGLEPNPCMQPHLEEQAAKYGITFDLSIGHAEAIPFPDNSVDAVVCTLVLCSVHNPEQVVSEILRVLKPDGKLYFLEHVSAQPGTLLRFFQRGLAPLWRQFTDGCNPHRETWKVLEAAGFRELDMRHEEIKTPFVLIKHHILGVATK